MGNENLMKQQENVEKTKKKNVKKTAKKTERKD